MRIESTARSLETNKVNHLPEVGDIIVCRTGQVPANYSINNGEQRWITYAVPTESGWELTWNPYRGLAVFIHKKDFRDLQNYPWVQRLEVVKKLKSSIVAKVCD
jgi:hypothetical protein